ncbi:MAG TPA: ParB/RepB/Spo0J family partition protein [Chloroflexi bacterium]|nr:ParB/RepB/Spo0J family partition protein [Chloroflexota bacterium]
MADRKRGLGRGLDALIPSSLPSAGEGDAIESGARSSHTQTQGVMQVPLAAISPNPHQPRSPIRDQDLVELAASIEEHGVIQPLIVTRASDGYQLVAGERRWRASRLAGLDKVPVLVKDVAPREMLELALVENIQRSDLNPLEEAMAYHQLTDEFGLTQEQVARRVGKSRVAVSNTLRLLKATPAVQQALMNGKISEGHARALLRLTQETRQIAALDIVLKRGMNVRQTEELVRRWAKTERKTDETGDEPASEEDLLPRAYTRSLESRFRETLGTRVTLTRGEDGQGKLVIYFYSDEELNALYERIVGEE